MANEFVIKNGFHSKGDSQITGSLNFSGGVNQINGLDFGGLLNISASSAFFLNTLHVGDLEGDFFQFDPSTKRFDARDFGAKFLNITSSGGISASGHLIFSSSIGYPHSTFNVAVYDTASGQLYFTGSSVIPSNAGGSNSQIQFNNSGVLSGRPIFTFNTSNGVIQMDSGSYFGGAQGMIRTANSVLELNAEGDSVKVDIHGPDDETRIKALDTGVEISGSIAGGAGTGLRIKGSITGDTSLNIAGTGGISSSAGLMFRGNSISRNIITTPTTAGSGTSTNVIYIQPGTNTGGTGGIGAHVYLRGADQSNASGGGNGGNVYIGGGDYTNTSKVSGSVYLDGNGIFANPSLNTNTLKNYAGTQVLVSQSIAGATTIHGNNSGGTQIFESGESLFQIYRAGSPYVATISASNNQYESRVIATYGRFSEIEGGSPLVINVGTSTLKISASNFNVSTAGEMSSGGSDGISTTSITASSDISSSGTITGNSFVKGGGTSAQFLKADGSVDSNTYSTATGVENNADVTDTTNVTAAGALMDSEVDADIKTLTLPAETTISTFGKSLVDDADAETARTTLGLGSAAIAATGISNTNVPVFTSGVADDDFLRVNGTSIEGLNASEVKTALGVGDAFPFTGSANISGSSEIIGSGSGIFSVEGSVGTLFTVNDGLDDVIFAANNVSGTPVISANADNTVKLGKLGGFGIVISGSTPAPTNDAAKIIMTGSLFQKGSTAFFSSSMGVGTSAQGTIGRIDASNDVVAFSTSDERLKDNITPIEDALNKVSQVQGIEFDWVEKEGIHGNEGHDVGVIAQEIEKVLPEVVTTRDNGYKAVKYEKIIPLLVEAIKELQAEVQELKNNK